VSDDTSCQLLQVSQHGRRKQAACVLLVYIPILSATNRSHCRIRVASFGGKPSFLKTSHKSVRVFILSSTDRLSLCSTAPISRASFLPKGVTRCLARLAQGSVSMRVNSMHNLSEVSNTLSICSNQSKSDPARPVDAFPALHQSQQAWAEQMLKSVLLMTAKCSKALSRRVKAIPIDADMGVMTANESRTQFMMDPSNSPLSCQSIERFKFRWHQENGMNKFANPLQLYSPSYYKRL
jgi:hypothetical protein